MAPKKWKIRIGLFFISISVLIFLLLLVVPFFGGINLREKISFSAAILVIGEILYWVGVLLIGKELWKKYKIWLRSGKWLE
jgi:hypothetical protein